MGNLFLFSCATPLDVLKYKFDDFAFYANLLVEEQNDISVLRRAWSTPHAETPLFHEAEHCRIAAWIEWTGSCSKHGRSARRTWRKYETLRAAYIKANGGERREERREERRGDVRWGEKGKTAARGARGEAARSEARWTELGEPRGEDARSEASEAAMGEPSWDARWAELGEEAAGLYRAFDSLGVCTPHADNPRASRHRVDIGAGRTAVYMSVAHADSDADSDSDAGELSALLS